MSKILVHICCAPDAVYFLKRLREDFPHAYIKGFFYDPNIHPYEEYKLRYVETQRVCNELGIELEEGEYDVEAWMEKVKGYEKEPERGERCKLCFDFRLERSAKFAKEEGFTTFTTTLLMSPKKKFEQLKKSGEEIAEKYSISFLALNYRKGGGTQEMFTLSKDREIYHQDYCGCVHGLFNQKGELAVWDLVSCSGRQPGSKEETLFIKSIRAFAEELSLPVKEFEFPFLSWFLLEGKVEIDKKIIPSFVEPYSQSIRGVAKGEVYKQVGDELYLNKQYVKIKLLEPFQDIPLREPKLTTHPTFLVPYEYRDVFLNSRVTATLKTEFRSSVSRIMVIGNVEAERRVGIPADTLQDGAGVSKSFVEELLSSYSKDIATGRLSVLILGAESFGRLGSRFFKELTGVDVNEFVDYRQNVFV